ncbi:hypothetical protein [Synechococcus sp. UW179A]|nr:hypothetical protein [Synechococcus sp. UW179A]
MLALFDGRQQPDSCLGGTSDDPGLAFFYGGIVQARNVLTRWR